MERILEAESTFTSDMGRAYSVLLKLGAVGVILMPLAAVIGQYRTDRFPDYPDLFAAVLLVVGIVVLFAAIFFAAGKYYKVYVGPSYVYCYSTALTYKLVSWPEVQDVVLMNYYGLHYLYVYSSGSKNPLTIPLWLSDMARFQETVKRSAGPDHTLTRHLEEYSNLQR